MKPIKTTAIAGLFAAFALAGLSPISAAEATQFDDASRVIAIGGSLTEIVFALGEEDKLVARDTTATYPPKAFALPDVGYMRALSPEGVLSVSPSALLVIEGSGPPEALDVLGQSGVPTTTIPEEHSHAGILAKIRAVGAALGADAKASALADEVDQALNDAQALTKDVQNKKRVLFILSAIDGRLLVSGKTTAADSVINMAGAINAVTDFPGYKALTHEALIAANPDVILMMDRGDHSSIDAQLWADPALAMTPAGKDKRIIRMDGGYLLGFGPRTASAVRELAHTLYADQLQPE